MALTHKRSEVISRIFPYVRPQDTVVKIFGRWFKFSLFLSVVEFNFLMSVVQIPVENSPYDSLIIDIQLPLIRPCPPPPAKSRSLTCPRMSAKPIRFLEVYSRERSGSYSGGSKLYSPYIFNFSCVYQLKLKVSGINPRYGQLGSGQPDLAYVHAHLQQTNLFILDGICHLIVPIVCPIVPIDYPIIPIVSDSFR